MVKQEEILNVIAEKKNSIQVTVASLLAIALTVGLWRSLYEYGSISAASLIPLTVLIIIGSYHTLLGSRQAYLDSILTDSTGLRKILKGRVWSAIRALVIAGGGVFLIAYKGLAAERWELTVAAITVISASISFAIIREKLDSHVNEKYLLAAVSNLNVLLMGTVFFLLYTYALWEIQTYPTYLKNESLLVSLGMAMNDLPQGAGITAVIVEYAFTLETLKRWAVVNSAQMVAITPIVYVLYGAIFGYFQVKVVTSVVCAVSLIIKIENREVA